MYTIIGGDGKEYGPVSLDQLRAWVAGGRANMDTRVRIAGTGEWLRVGDLPEFGGAPLPPPIPAATPVPVPIGTADAIPLLARTAAPMEPADRGTRLGAFTLDYLLSVVCALPALIMLPAIAISGALNGGNLARLVEIPGMILAASISGMALLVLTVIQICMISIRGQSIGKRIVGIRIVRVGDGSKPGFVHGWLIRQFVPKVISAIPYIGVIFFLVDSFFIFRDDRRCLHDLMADTRVVKMP